MLNCKYLMFIFYIFKPSMTYAQAKAEPHLNLLVFIETELSQFFPQAKTLFLGTASWRWIFAGLSVLILLLMKRFMLTKLLKWFKTLSGKTENTFDDQVVELLNKPLSCLLMIVGIYGSSNWINLSESLERFINFCYRISLIILFTWFLVCLIELSTKFLEDLAAKSSSTLDDYVVPFVSRIIKIATYSIGGMLVIQEFGINVAGIIAGLGVGGLAFALAAQETLANWFGAIMIYTDRPFEVGHWIKTSQFEGVVEEVGLRSTRIRTFAQTVVSIPNRQIAVDVIENFNKMQKRRISLKLGVTYETTPAMLEESVERIRDILRNHEEVDQSFWLVKFTDFGDSALEIFVYYFTLTTNWEEYLSIKQEINLRIMQRLKAIGVEFAFPSMSIYQAVSDPEQTSKLDAQARRLFSARAPEVVDHRKNMTAPSESNADG